MKKYIYSLALFTGTAIGVGLFGLPYAAAQIGFFPILIYFIVLGALMLTIHLMFGEICLRTTGQHRMPGYAKIYLGKRQKIVLLISNMIGAYGILLAYIIVGGGFLANLLMPILGGNAITYILLFFGVGSLIIYLGSQTIAKSEIISLTIFFGVLIFLVVKSIPEIEISHFFNFEPKNIFLPYGIILFALPPTALIPELRDMLAEKGHLLKSVIIVGTLIPILTYLAFIFLVLGVSGPDTTEDALTGLVKVLGNKVLIAGFIFGIITTFTSFITVGLTLKKVFWYDLKISHFKSWIITIFVPIILYFIGLQDFIKIIIFTGGVTFGISTILILLIYKKAKKKSQRKPEYELPMSKFIIYFLMVIFVIGAVLTVVTI